MTVLKFVDVIKKLMRPTIIHKTFEINCSFHEKQPTILSEPSTSLFQEFFAKADKISILDEGLSTRQ